MGTNLSAKLISTMLINVQTYLEKAIVFITVVTLITAVFFNNFSMKIYTIITVLSIIGLIINIKHRKYDLTRLGLPCSMLLLGIIDVIWYKIFKTNDSLFRGTYHNYQNMGKIFIFSFFPILMVATSKNDFKLKYLSYLLYSLTFILFGVAIYLKLTTDIVRLDFGIGTATGAAYSIVIVGIISSSAILYTPIKNTMLYVINCIAVYSMIIMTETRAAIIIFPLIMVLILLSKKSITRREIIKSVSIVAALLLMTMMIFKNNISDRYKNALDDIAQYQQNNSINSLGARLAMYEAGYKIFIASPIKWRSAETRSEEITKLAQENKIYLGAIPFLNMHLHNDLIESASLKGISGIIATLLFYISALSFAWNSKSTILAGIIISIALIGCSDVLLISKSLPIIIITALMLAIYVTPINPDKKN